MQNLITFTHICDVKTFEIFDIGNNFTDATLIRDLNNIALKLNDSLHYCEWHYKDKKCSEMFRPILTEEGICFTFNSLNSRDIYSEM